MRLHASRAHVDPDRHLPADDWAVVSGVPCQHIAMPYPWATTAHVLAVPKAPAADAVAEVLAWLAARSTFWSLLVHLADETAFAGFQRWELMPVRRLVDRPRVPPAPHVEVGPARNPEEFLLPYGAQRTPKVTEAHLAADHIYHLVARIDGEPVDCVLTVLPAARRMVSTSRPHVPDQDLGPPGRRPEVAITTAVP